MGRCSSYVFREVTITKLRGRLYVISGERDALQALVSAVHEERGH